MDVIYVAPARDVTDGVRDFRRRRLELRLVHSAECEAKGFRVKCD